MSSFFDVTGQGWLQLEELTLAFVLSALVGLEREARQKSAGLRTYTLVGVSAALFMLISKYGFMDVLANGRVVVDPSRVAAQIVSGIGFIGGGVIFMRRDVVRGLTTAASVWLTAALGMACGAGLPVLAVATTIGHFVIMFVFPKLVRLLPKERRTATRIRISYQDGRGLLRTILIACTNLRFAIDQVEIEREGVFSTAVEEARERADEEGVEVGVFPRKGDVVLCMNVKGKRPISHLIAKLSDIDGVVGVGTVEGPNELARFIHGAGRRAGKGEIGACSLVALLAQSGSDWRREGWREWGLAGHAAPLLRVGERRLVRRAASNCRCRDSWLAEPP